mmetsp:Transcript_11092/g.16875  ORF Transcript_11092/g.16875 Transcript_11092/m.16875 type:complete len:147 (+) Transcript_11092:328-768(+)|eukprot:CAMPEP_0170488630 /NCGR_PEP_ID=MMETSP0208-20121228/7139_1 /TAXON_ID=197538 /ORGANISM="Strombidium inclinatum, Strain S3" /LENGTH=146 /DNA_ID=CAMNT_0010763261 /DNA_START=356 /DNA_END=796 /DNA_ORIENTATION=-
MVIVFIGYLIMGPGNIFSRISCLPTYFFIVYLVAKEGLLLYVLGLYPGSFLDIIHMRTAERVLRKVRATLVSKERMAYGRLLYDPAKDCLICFGEFEANDEVEQPCESKHLYHARCLDQMEAHQLPKECPFCINKVDFTKFGLDQW